MSKFMQVDGSRNRLCTVTALDGSSRSRHTLESTTSPMRLRSMPDDASAFSPAIAAASMNDTPSGHWRRWLIPASDSSRPVVAPVRS